MSESTPVLRLVWPQWQGASPQSVAPLTAPMPYAAAQRGYSLGSRILELVAPVGGADTVVVPVSSEQGDLTVTDGIYARSIVLDQLREALRLLDERNPERVVTLGGECSVSVAPFAHLARRYGDDLAVVWVDAHPDTGMPEASYDGYHAMAVSVLLGHGDAEFVEALPATVDASRVALTGLHAWDDDQEPYFREWGLATFAPDDLRTDSEPLLTWLRGTGCSKVAVHFDVDTIDGNEVVLGLGADPGGLSSTQVVRVINDVAGAADLVGLTIAEYVPRQVITLVELLKQLPLLGDTH
ncbi:arginase family protein [Aestuariimicrobium ganziense]|uniref:arginase family protein n=1 Tax=Aestuariimicrobium ganziense TaxID=2773677 RepID=UPI001943E2A5|nr:arginase family protein [Aestuariimicrobium ganziense]